MTTAISSPAALVNLALARVGYKGRIGSLYDGSLAAKKALDLYSQTRDDLIREGNWEFAERIVTGTLVKQAPAGGYVITPWSAASNPDLPWLFSYAYPSDCLKVRSVRQTPMFVPNFDPQHNVFSLGNDTGSTPAVRVILCNVPNAMITYAGQVTDPTTWDSEFTEALAAALGRRLAPVLVGLDAAKLELSDEQAEKALAEQDRG